MPERKDNNNFECPYYFCPLRGEGCNTESDPTSLEVECDMFKLLVELKEKLKSMLPYRFDDEDYQLLKKEVGWLEKIFNEIEDRAVDEFLKERKGNEK